MSEYLKRERCVDCVSECKSKKKARFIISVNLKVEYNLLRNHVFGLSYTLLWWTSSMQLTAEASNASVSGIP